MAKVTAEAAEMFAAKGADKIYLAILASLRKDLGAKSVIVESKQTCVHLLAKKDGPAFMGIHPRMDAVLITLKLSEPWKSKRVKKVQQASASRWHIDLVVGAEVDIDEELRDRMRQGWQLAMDKKPAKEKTK